MSRGFTLIEMVITIILLGIVGLFLGNIAGQAMGIYVDSTAREALIQQGRFITERMSRELREAVPNSVLVNDDQTCIEFLPITNSAIYSALPSAAGPFRLLPINKQVTQGERLVVLPRDTQSLLGYLSPNAEQIALIKESVVFDASNQLTMVDVAIAAANPFSLQSPAGRVYLYRDPVAYCYISSEQRMYRYQGYPLTRNQLAPAQLGSGVLMAENISRANFVVDVASLQRNGLIKIELTFADRGEEVRFDHNALIYNTP
ncbi:type II secretion system protein [Vibrio cholerae]|uniref:PilW family protein n=1 Tax=Vibrio cholerae TaxID=666 RepID=UPI00028D1B3B|nr:type II secretion system protein [Vibrio cholerae]EKL04392.1 prepilin-type N-terminal cleavage/methylation domain protein [Vibrio cholerae HC-41B1]EKL98441.1 prepilin-type N-terminal cleavage/methylation domain protein [Vibrio cholerae HC-46B1]EKM05673.1 prepilin-type N-terminal cleavage/methylation domain protein [Vibrio cholerae HC-44C1]GHZ53148.1 MSHA biogenesis protein MshO protein [Vibrio cholerae]